MRYAGLAVAALLLAGCNFAACPSGVDKISVVASRALGPAYVGDVKPAADRPIALDAAGRLLLPQDAGFKRRAADGTAEDLSPPGAARIEAATAMPDGSVLVADAGGAIRRLDAAGTWSQVATFTPTPDGWALRLVPLGRKGDALLADGNKLYRVPAAGPAVVPMPGTEDVVGVADVAPGTAGEAVAIAWRSSDKARGLWILGDEGPPAISPWPGTMSKPVGLAYAGGDLHVVDEWPNQTFELRRYAAAGTGSWLIASFMETDPRVHDVNGGVFRLQCMPLTRLAKVSAMAGAPDGTLWAVVDGRLLKVAGP